MNRKRQGGFLLNPFRFGGPAPGGTYYSEVMADSPVVYWRFGELSGTVAADSSGNGKAAVYQQDAATVTCPGLILSDSNTAIDLPGTPTNAPSGAYYAGTTVDLSASWSFECLLRPDAAPALGGVGIVTQMGVPAGGTNYPEIDVFDRGAGEFSLRVMNSGMSELILTTATWAYGDEFHLFLRHLSGGGLELYADGVLVGSTNWTYGGNPGEVRVGYGAFNGTTDSYPYAGVMDEVALYTAALSPARIAAHAAARTA